MDIFLHALVGTAMKRKSKWWMAALFGVMPDIIGLGGLFAWQPYHFSHSYIAIMTIAIIILVLKLPIELAGIYAFHVISDIPLHRSGTSDFFFPFNDPIGFSGIDWWSTFWIEAVGYVLVLTFLYIRWKRGDYRR